MTSVLTRHSITINPPGKPGRYARTDRTRNNSGQGVKGLIGSLSSAVKPLPAHTPGITAHAGRPGEIPSAAGITNVMKRVIRTHPMIFRAKPALAISFVEMHPVP